MLEDERREKLRALRRAGDAYPNNFRRKDLALDLASRHGDKSKDQLEKERMAATVAGRMMLKRVMGKASFATLQDGSGRIQIYISNEVSNYEQFKHWDLGDILGVEGTLFKTNKGELTIHARKITLLVKALRPLPEKFHGLADQEVRYRQRYVDLIVNPQVKDVFLARTKVIQ
jgi:lysyl-tRNA synthetase class 2